MCRFLIQIDVSLYDAALPCVVNEVAHGADCFQIRFCVVVWIPVNVMNDLPFLGAKAAILTGEIVSLEDFESNFLPRVARNLHAFLYVAAPSLWISEGEVERFHFFLCVTLFMRSG